NPTKNRRFKLAARNPASCDFMVFQGFTNQQPFAMAEWLLCVRNKAAARLHGMFSGSKPPVRILASTEGSGRK
ncbi:MAG: hypothetical protein AB2541_00800, partial [Candidatus Thiodiazotropha sp.]